MRAHLTAKQQNIFNFLCQHVREHGYPPSYEEIAGEFDFASPNAVTGHLKALEKKGFIRRSEKSRAIEILDPAFRQNGIPIVGTVAAGSPIAAIENREGTLGIDDLFGHSEGLFALRVRGESMIGAGINPGDYVVVREQPVIDSGQIGVAFMDGEATVKRIFREPSGWRLQPENSGMQPIWISQGDETFRVGGRVVGVVRRVQM
ncbi:MAG: transcriptional repressor LexA [Candidatus Brocadiae bacterium]|nr:transcriptional repressor LexA [Candidatus Brocadiia bacterium]